MRALLYVAVSLAALGVLTYLQQAQPAPVNSQAEDAPRPEQGGGFSLDGIADWAQGLGRAAESVNPWSIMERNTVQASAEDENVRAFLAMVSHSEGTDRAADPYAVCYAYRHTIADFGEHPAVSGEWRGEPLDKLGAAYVGKVSTAAGRYQIIAPTWKRCRNALGLSDFGPEAQDAAAVYLIDKRGALDDVKAGRFADAVEKCRPEWASLPGAGAGQPERKLAELEAFYINAGGVLA